MGENVQQGQEAEVLIQPDLETTTVRRKPTRTIGAAGLVLVFACPGLACDSSDDAPAARDGTATSQSREQPPGRRATVWRRAVPVAYLRASASPEASQRGTRLSAHWLGRNGIVIDRDPSGTVVEWPTPMRVSAMATPAFRIVMPEKPDRVDIRVFGGTIDSAGVPVEQPQLIACSPDTLAQGCRFTVRRGGVDVVLLNRTRRPVTRLVLYANWYVPFAQRPPTARSNATVSASWGFVVATRPNHRRQA